MSLILYSCPWVQTAEAWAIVSPFVGQPLIAFDHVVLAKFF